MVDIQCHTAVMGCLLGDLTQLKGHHSSSAWENQRAAELQTPQHVEIMHWCEALLTSTP